MQLCLSSVVLACLFMRFRQSYTLWLVGKCGYAMSAFLAAEPLKQLSVRL